MTPKETIALWQDCEKLREQKAIQGHPQHVAHEDAQALWNSWAAPLVEQRKQLSAQHLLQFESEQYPGFIAPRKRAANRETLQFQDRAFVDFSGFRFTQLADFTGFIFPSDVRFDADVRDRLSTPAIFERFLRLHECVIYGDLIFRRAECLENAGFRGTVFHGDANFAESIFNKSVWFRESIFCGDVWFGQTQFRGYCDFISATFRGEAAFHGIQAAGIFDLTHVIFDKLPDFHQANFKEAPDLDSTTYPQHSFWAAGNVANITKYRAIRRLAIQGHNYEHEAKAFKGELRSRRQVVDKIVGINIWLGIFYDTVADCGRSIARPIFAWLILSLAFAYFYFRQSIMHGDAWKQCMSMGGDPLIQAVYLSLKNAFVVFGGGRDPRLLLAYQCLYGGSESAPAIPLSISFVEAFLQTPVSAILLFLFFLAVRNQFKIK